MDKFVAKMEKAGLSKAAIDAFKVNYEQLVEGATGMVSFKVRLEPIVLFRRLIKMEYFHWGARLPAVTQLDHRK